MRREREREEDKEDEDGRGTVKKLKGVMQNKREMDKWRGLLKRRRRGR
jgi:hypothetical protein